MNNRILIALSLFCLGFASALGANAAENGFSQGERANQKVGEISILLLDDMGNEITSIQRGETLFVSAGYEETDPTNATAVLRIPVTDAALYGAPSKVHRRFFDGGSTAISFTFHIPPFVQIEGTARIRVIVDGVGTGIATIDVTP